MNDHWLSQLGPVVTFLFLFAAFARRRSKARRPRPEQRPARRNSIVPTPRVTAPATPPAAAAPRPVRRRLAEPAVPAPPAPRPRAAVAPAMSDMLPAEAAAAFPVLDLSLGDAEPAGTALPARPRARRSGARIGSRGWGVNAIVAAEVLGTPVGLRPGATVGVPHAF